MSSSSCVQCTHPRDVGTRCFRHYVYVLAFERGLFKYRWFKRHFDEVVAGLRGRWFLIQSGDTPCTAHELAVVLWRNIRLDDHPPTWVLRKVSDRVKPGRSRDSFYKFVAALDKRARQDGPEHADGSSTSTQEEDGGGGAQAVGDV